MAAWAVFVIAVLGVPRGDALGQTGFSTQRITASEPKLCVDLRTGEIRGTVRSLAVCPVDPTKIALMVTALGEKVIWLYDTETGEGHLASSSLGEEDELLGAAKAKDDDVAWRPIPDGRGRLWYAFAGLGDVGEPAVYAGWFGSNRTYQVTTDLAFVGWVRWSPDGRSIAFHGSSALDEGGRIFLAEDLDALIAAGDPAQTPPRPPRQLTTIESYYPDWSPDGKTIAFSGEVGGLALQGAEVAASNYENWAICSMLPGKPKTPPAILTIDRTETDEWRPTWSPDGDYIAYHITTELIEREHEAGEDEIPGRTKTSRIEVIRIVEGDCRVIRGQVQEGNYELEKNIVMDYNHGPVWGPIGSYTLFYIPIYGRPGSGFEAAIRQPIRYVKMLPWITFEERSDYDIDLDTGMQYHTIVEVDPAGRRAVFAITEGVNSRLYTAEIFGEDLLPIANRPLALERYGDRLGAIVQSPCRTCWRDPRCFSCWYRGLCTPLVPGAIVAALLGGGGTPPPTDLLGSPPAPPPPPTSLLLKR